MDEIKEVAKYYLSGIIDFKGQELADRYTSIIVYGGVTLSVLVGFLTSDFDKLLMGLGITFVSQLIFCLPIPAYRRNPVKWLPVNRKGVEIKE